MFICKNKNSSGAVSVQIIDKAGGRYKIIKAIGSGTTDQEIAVLYRRAQQVIKTLSKSVSMFTDEQDASIEAYLSGIGNNQIQVIGPELIFGKLYDQIGFNQIEDELFRHIVITRLYHPGSKLKTIDYMRRFLNVSKSVDEIYRFLDKMSLGIKAKAEQIAFEHTKRNTRRTYRHNVLRHDNASFWSIGRRLFT